MQETLGHRRVLIVIGGGIAAYKVPELVRMLRRTGCTVRCIPTQAALQFVTPMTLAAVSNETVPTDLFDLDEEVRIGHIAMSRDADLIVVAPATANLIARMAAGIADDLPTTLLLATDTPVLVAPAMNVRMWDHPATRRNVAQLRADGVTVMDPDDGAMACGEYGPGRLPEPAAIVAEIARMLTPIDRPLAGRHIIITAGPTHEPIDPVRYLANRSSGKQGFALARAAAARGARVTLIAGPVALPTPAGVTRVDVATAVQMAAAVDAALPADAAIMAAAVADWRIAAPASGKIKKAAAPAALPLVANPDILAGLADSPDRPRLVVGFAAETDDVLAHARAKRLAKRCDWIIANDVSGDVMGGDTNRVTIVTAAGEAALGPAPKATIADGIMERIADALAQ